MNPTPSVLPIEAGQQEPAKLLHDLVEAERAWNAAHPIRKVDIAERLEIERLSAWARAQAYVAAHPPAQEAAEPSDLREMWDEFVMCAGHGVTTEQVAALEARIFQAPAQKDAP